MDVVLCLVGAGGEENWCWSDVDNDDVVMTRITLLAMMVSICLWLWQLVDSVV